MPTLLDNLKNKYLDILKPVSQTLGNVGQQVQQFTQPARNLAQSGGLIQRVAPQVPQFMNQNFSSTQGRFNPIAQVKAVTQMSQPQALQYRQQVEQTVPRLNIAQNIQNLYYRILGEIGQGIVNTPLNAVAGMAKFPAARTFQQGAADIASIAEAPLMFGGLGVGKEIVKQGVKQVVKQGVKQSIIQGAKTGGVYGGAFGGLEGLREGEYDSVVKQLGKVVLGTGTGVVAGGILGGGLSGAGALLKKYIFKSPQVEKQLRDAQGRWVAGELPVKPTGMPKAQWDFQLKFNEKHGRNPYIPVYVNDLSRELPQPGLSIKYTKKPSSGLQGGVKKVQTIPIGKDLLEVQPTTPKIGQIISKPPVVKVTGVGQVGGAGKPPLGTSIPDQDLITRLTQGLKEAEPIRGTQEELYIKARGEKLARLMSAREKMAGEKGFFQELGALKGELPKVQYEAIRQQFDQPSVDRLFNMVKENKFLDDWEKINAQVGLAKILGKEGGGVPTKGEIAKLYQVFGKDFTEALLSKRPLMNKLGDLALQTYNIPRSFMAGIGDFSGTLMQNAQFAYRHPIITAKNFVQQLRFFASEEAFRMSGEEIASRPTYPLMKQAKLSLTEVGPIVSQREEQFMGSLAEKIPGLGRLVRATGRAYTGFLNRMRADVFDYMVNVQKGMGGDIKDPKFLKDTGHFVNIFTGRGDLGQMERIVPVLGQGLFSARKLMATFQTLDPRLYITSTPAVRREALLTMLSYLGGTTLITQLSRLAGGEVGENPTSTDFGKIKFGNTRFNLYGPFQQLAVLFARLWKGYATSSTTGKKIMLGDESNPYSPTRLDLLTRYFESKEHPTLSLIFSALRGTNNIGQPFNVTTETLNRFIPMVLADAYDLYKEQGPIGLLGTIPAILGIPAQTYGSQIPNIETTSTGKPTIKLKPVGGIAEDIISGVTRQPQSNVPLEQQQALVQSKVQTQQEQNQRDEIRKVMQAGEFPQASLVGGGVYSGQQPTGQMQTTMKVDGIDTLGYKVGNYFMYQDEFGEVKTTKIATLEKQQLAKEKELTDVQYTYIAEQLKRADDYQKWTTMTQDYVKYLEDYKKKLTDEVDKIRIQNKIEDLKVSLEKYRSYGGFTKPKKPKKVSFKGIKALKLKIPKAKTIKVKTIKPKKIKVYKLSKTKKLSTKVKKIKLT